MTLARITPAAGRSRVHRSHRVERSPRPVDERGNAVFLCLRNMIAETVKFFDPERMVLGFFKIEQAGIENRFGWNLCEIGFDYARIGVEASDDLTRRSARPVRHRHLC